ncbi:MAG TPA: thioredoxin domain-containing protein [Alphaproteobacteria bacterium]|nr:thioredoxin domain-containing protein [Alphaproteobacteria bacterium]
MAHGPAAGRAPVPGNRLGQETSPYLLQHAHNPVHWYAWGPEAFAEAAASNRPILLSVGYAACHWCHVMAHESFEDAATAALMNELFVNIKVDREERPDIDTIYQHALALTGEHGGWPLTMFLTPKGEPFWGGTYFPPQARYGRPAFRDVLKRIAEIYRNEHDKVTANTTALRDALAHLSHNHPAGAVPIAVIDQLARQFMSMIDTAQGGLKGAPKFPQVPVFELLWRAWRRTGTRAYRDAVTITLDRMSQGGIYDHVGGGFARYSVDDYWLVPHFEKMLYDNAQLIDLLTLAWQETRSALYAARAAETVGWVAREMTTAEGGFASSLDADSEGEEGKYYVWTEDEIDRLLGADAAAFKAAYDVAALGNWEHKSILNRSRSPLLGAPDAEAKLARSRAILLAERAKRVPPGLDDKVLADWNGLMIAALANAGRVFDHKDWIDLAARAFTFVRMTMTDNGRVRHSWRAGRAVHAATLDDYANLGRAALALYEATFARDYIEQAEAWLGIVERRYRDNQGGGYFFTADDVGDLIVRTKTAQDQATPAGNATLVGVYARLYHLTGANKYRDHAEALVAAFSGGLERSAFGLTTLLNNNELLQMALQIVVCGTAGDPATEALLRAVYERSLPNRVVQLVAPGSALPAAHPAHGKGPIDGRATAYVCRGSVCTLPLTDATALGAELDRP